MLEYYYIFFGALLVCALFSGIVSGKLRSTYAAYKDMPCRSNMTGYDTARRLLVRNGVTDVSIGKVSGTLTDHYHPTKGVVNLSEGVYGNNSVAAVAIAAHEVGHVLQNKKGYFAYKLRAFLVPITNFGSYLAMPLVILGLVLDLFVIGTQNSSLGFTLAIVGVCLYGLSALFALVTLPVEFNASARAKKQLQKEGILTAEELPFAEKMLSAAALTYVAALATSLVYFLRFALWVFLLFGGRRRR